MADMTQQELEAAVEKDFDAVADQVFDNELEGQFETATNPADFRVTDTGLAASSAFASRSLVKNIGRLSLNERKFFRVAPMGTSDNPAIDTEEVIASADDTKRGAAAKGVKDYLCNTLREEIKKIIDKLKEWLKDGIKATLKKIAGLAKELTIAAVTAIAAIVGSTTLAYIFIGIAVAAVGAAIYFLVKNGIPNYCQLQES